MKMEKKTTLKEFETRLLVLNNLGRDLTLKHKEMYPTPKKGEKEQTKGGRRYHAPATNLKCALCKQIIKAHDDFMAHQNEHLEITGIPIENLMAAIKITRATILMMKNGGEI